MYYGIRKFYNNFFGMWEACSYQNINLKDAVRIDITSFPEIKEILNLQVSWQKKMFYKGLKFRAFSKLCCVCKQKYHVQKMLILYFSISGIGFISNIFLEHSKLFRIVIVTQLLIFTLFMTNDDFLSRQSLETHIWHAIILVGFKV